jgi:hypothetical protein
MKQIIYFINKHCIIYKSFNLQKVSSGSCLHNALTWHFQDPAQCNKNSLTWLLNCNVPVRTFRTDVNNKVCCNVSRHTYNIWFLILLNFHPACNTKQLSFQDISTLTKIFRLYSPSLPLSDICSNLSHACCCASSACQKAPRFNLKTSERTTNTGCLWNSWQHFTCVFVLCIQATKNIYANRGPWVLHV